MSTQFDLSPLEADVLRVIRKAGLQVQLWFPIVKREALDLKTHTSDEQIHAAVAALARKHAITDVETRCLLPPNWVASPEVPHAEENPLANSPAILPEEVTDTGSQSLSLLEAQIILTIANIGWYAYLWFPKIQRGMMNFGSDEPVEKVHSTLVGLTRRGLLVVTENADVEPEWNPIPAALELATNLDFPSQIP